MKQFVITIVALCHEVYMTTGPLVGILFEVQRIREVYLKLILDSTGSKYYIGIIKF